MSLPFWELPLGSLDDEQWEALCDGCGQCCLTKLQDEETDEIFATDVVCQFLDQPTGRCGVYKNRVHKKPECFVIDRNNPEHYSWLPKTCAYRLRHEDKPLPDWHPLLAGDRSAMKTAGIAVSEWSTCESQVKEIELPDRVIFSLRD